MIVFAQLSDTHLDGGQPRADRVRAVMASLVRGRAPLDAVLVTGDIADHGLPAEYEQARSLLTAPWPVLFLRVTTTIGPPSVVCCSARTATCHQPGAQDLRGRDRRPVRLHHPRAMTTGYLADETLAWLDTELGADPADPGVRGLPPSARAAAYRDQ